jgi:D-alanine--D-alanine ligase
MTEKKTTPTDLGGPRVAVIGGGANDEHDVSLASAAAVARALRELGAEPVPLTIDRAGGWHLEDEGALSPAQAVAVLGDCALAFPVLHGVRGEDGAVAGLLVMTGVPFVGSPVRAGALATDKWATKLVAEAVGVSTAPSVLVRDGDGVCRGGGHGPRGITLAPPLVVKPTSGGSSDGVSRVDDLAELPAAVAHARTAGDLVLVESFVEGREVDIALFRDAGGVLRAGSTLEIAVDPHGVFDRDSKYDGSADFTVPAGITLAEHAAVERAARTLYEALGCDGVARFDFFVTPTGIVLNEVNTSPGFTERSQVPLMFAAVGVGYVELVAELVDAALAGAALAGAALAGAASAGAPAAVAAPDRPAPARVGA